MDLSQVKIVELNAILEIGVPIEKVESYKTESGVRRLLQRIAVFISMHIGNIGEFGVGLPVHHADWKHDDFIEINDFGYSCNNECPKSKTQTVFRGFGLTLYLVRPKDEDKQFFGTYAFKVKECDVQICVSGQSVGDKNLHSSKRDEIEVRGLIEEMA